MKKTASLFLLVSLCLYGGCSLIGNLGTPTRHERSIPAEYNLAEQKDKTILVLVEQPTWVDIRSNMRRNITNKINDKLKSMIEIKPERLITYDTLADYRSSDGNFSLLKPSQIGKKLGADLVLYVIIDGYELAREVDYYKGGLDTQVVLINISGDKLWPGEDNSKVIKVGFDIGGQIEQVANARLVEALGHCIVRYLYDCPKERFKIADDRSGEGWKDW